MKNIALQLLIPAVLMTSPSMHGQVATAGTAAAVAVAPHLASDVPAILTSAVSSGSARVGQSVLAKLASAGSLSDGTRLPAGTQLLGKVTQAVPLARGGGQSTLAMAFDRLKLPNGQERPLETSVLHSIRGLGAHGSASGDASVSGADNGGAEVSTQANTNASDNNGGGGLLGGVGSAVGGAVNSAGNVVGDTMNGVARTTGSLLGVVVSTTGTLTAQGRNVSIPAGTHVSIAASTNASAQ